MIDITSIVKAKLNAILLESDDVVTLAGILGLVPERANAMFLLRSIFGHTVEAPFPFDDVLFVGKEGVRFFFGHTVEAPFRFDDILSVGKEGGQRAVILVDVS